MKKTEDIGTLQMALVGYGIEKDRIEKKMKAIRSRIDAAQGKNVTSISTGATQGQEHHIGATGRNNIRKAQRRSWAAARKRATKDGISLLEARKRIAEEKKQVKAS